MPDIWSNPPTAAFANEADVELCLVIPLLHGLGYEPDDIASKYPVEFREGRVGRKPEADFVCFAGPLHNRDTSLLVVEAKRPGEALPDGRLQGESYAANLRAPLLLLTNGDRLEIWQLQTTNESKRILNIPLTSLVAERGTIEQVLGKASVVDYCRKMLVKTILEASADYGPYETAELKRTTRYAASITRTLQRVGVTQGNDRIETSRLLAEAPSGAVIVAPSGYGKTTLSYRLFRQAIEERWRGSRSSLAFYVPLPDLVETGLGLIAFVQERLTAHGPGITAAVFTKLLRESGATILCDGFDRVTATFQRKVGTEINNLIRDYPLTQPFVFSREAAKPRVSLPFFVLAPLSDDEKRELEKVILDDGSADFFSILGMLPNTLTSLCENPLLLQLTLEYWKREGKFPLQIEFIFRSWLDSTLNSQPGGAVSAIVREQALTLIAKDTAGSPISGTQAISLLNANGIPVMALDELVACDAVRRNGAAIEVQHEALADYLRAKDVASRPENVLFAELSGLSMPADSFFPVLLMAQLQTHGLQTALWKRLSNVSISAYLDALRYRFDVSSELERLEPQKLSEDYLGDLIEGIELPLNGFFPVLREAVTECLIGEGSGTIGVTGLVHAHPAELIYKLHPQHAEKSTRITVALPKGPGTLRSVNLDLSRYRLDSAHLLGMTLLRDTVLDLIKRQTLKGGAAWAAERLIGRCRFLAHEYEVPIALTDRLDKVEEVLKPNAGKWVDQGGFSGRERFSIQSLLDDVATLRANGTMQLDPWWLRLGWNDAAPLQDEAVLRQVLDEYYRRMQVIYAEIVQATFGAIAEEMTFISLAPVRWKLTVVRRDPSVGGSTIFYHWLPVASWDKAGADTVFSDKGVLFSDGEEARDALRKLGRPNSRLYHHTGFTQLPKFDGTQWTGYFDGATPVTHDVCEELKREVERAVSGLPGFDVG
jgi:hypothetical protein